MRFVVVIFRRDKKCAQDIPTSSKGRRESEHYNIYNTPSSVAVWQRFLFFNKECYDYCDGSVVFHEKLGINCV